MHDHRYRVSVDWTGNRGSGTSDHRAFGRDHVVSAAGKAQIAGSADPTFRGDRARWNPEELVLAALGQCHMLSYLHVAVQQGFTVVDYHDTADARLDLHPDGSGELVEAVLRPVVTILEPDRVADATAAHGRASELCFIARSVAFPVRHEPRIVVAAAPGGHTDTAAASGDHPDPPEEPPGTLIDGSEQRAADWSGRVPDAER